MVGDRLWRGERFRIADLYFKYKTRWSAQDLASVGWGTRGADVIGKFFWSSDTSRVEPGNYAY